MVLAPAEPPIEDRARQLGAQFETYWEEELENVFSRIPVACSAAGSPVRIGLELEFGQCLPAGERVTRASPSAWQPLDPEKNLQPVAAGARKSAPEATCTALRDCALVRTLPHTTHDAV